MADNIGAGFDGEAEDYLTRFCAHASATIMRDRTHAVFRKYLQANSSVLDLCCGPGPDFALWQQLGMAITGVDISKGMLQQAHKQAPLARLCNLDVAELGELNGPFHAISSNFGGLNTDVNLPALAENCARLLPGDGYLFTNIMTPTPLPELVEGIVRRKHFLRRLRFGRSSLLKVGSVQVRTRYYFVQEFFKPFRKDFRLIEVVGLGVVLPPPYVPWRGSARSLLSRCDRVLGSIYPFNRCGDHTLLVMQRRTRT